MMPLYLSLPLFKVAKAEGTHEGCIEQVYRLYRDGICGPAPLRDEAARGRSGTGARRADARATWNQVETDNINALTDFAGCKSDFLRLFGFEVEGVDYEAPVNRTRTSTDCLEPRRPGVACRAPRQPGVNSCSRRSSPPASMVTSALRRTAGLGWKPTDSPAARIMGGRWRRRPRRSPAGRHAQPRADLQQLVLLPRRRRCRPRAAATAGR